MVLHHDKMIKEDFHVKVSHFHEVGQWLPEAGIIAEYKNYRM